MSSLRTAITPPLSFRDHSLNAVLWQVHRAGVVSRAELTRTVGVNRSSIARVIAELIERGLIEPAGAYRPGTRGRPSLLVQGSATGPVALAAQLTASSIVVAAGALGGQLLLRKEQAWSAAAARPAVTLDRIGEMLGSAARGYRAQGVVEAVLVAPGRVAGDRIGAPLVGWHDVDAVAHLRTDLRSPLRAVSAADAAAVGEHVRGAGSGLASVVHVGGEPELVAGMVLDGQLFRGASGGAGQIAHLCVNVGGARCGCGRRGCLAAELQSVVSRQGLDGMLVAARSGDVRALRRLRTAGRRFGAALQQLTSLINPDAIVIGGAWGTALPYLRGGISAVYAETLQPAPRVLAAALGTDSAVVGGIEIGLQRLFTGSSGNVRPEVMPRPVMQREAG